MLALATAAAVGNVRAIVIAYTKSQPPELLDDSCVSLQPNAPPTPLLQCGTYDKESPSVRVVIFVDNRCCRAHLPRRFRGRAPNGGSR
jgi:hypothetical protein